MANVDDARIKAWLASAQMDKTKQYVEEGREFAGHSNEALNAMWLAGMAEWAANLPKPRPAIVDRSEAELLLRGKEPPHSDAKEYFATVLKHVEKLKERLDANPAEAERLGQGILDDMEAMDRAAKRSS